MPRADSQAVPLQFCDFHAGGTAQVVAASSPETGVASRPLEPHRSVGFRGEFLTYPRCFPRPLHHFRIT